jgi:hypothetical protein
MVVGDTRLDTRLPLMVEPPKFQPLTEIASAVQNIRSAQTQDQIRQAQLAELQREQQEKAAVQGAFRGAVTNDPTTGQPTLDRASALRNLYQQSPELAYKMEKEWKAGDVASRKEQRDAQKAELETLKTQIEMFAPLVAGVTDQASYDQALAAAQQMGLPNVERWPKQYNPQLVARFQEMLLSTKERTELALKQATLDQTTRYQTGLLEDKQIDRQFEREKFGTQTEQKERELTGAEEDRRLKREAQKGDAATKTEAQLRDDYLKVTKSYPEVRDAYSRITTAAASDGGVSDITLIYGYMKLLDPTSVVREGEYATAQKAGSVPDNIIAMYNRALKGDFLSPDVKQQFLTMADQLYQRHTADHEKVKTQFSEITTRGGGDPRNVTIDLGSTATMPSKPQAAPAPAPAKTAPALTPEAVKGQPLTEQDIQDTLAAYQQKGRPKTRAWVIEQAQKRGMVWEGQ